MTRTPTVTPEDIVKGAASVARDVADGRLNPADLEAQLVAELHALVGVVAGPGDPLWDLQCTITRQAIGLGALSADELSEWASVMRQRSGEPVTLPDVAPEPVSLPSGAHSPENGDAAPEPEAAPEAATVLALVPEIVTKAPAPTSVAGQAETGGGYDPLAGWRPSPRPRH